MTLLGRSPQKELRILNECHSHYKYRCQMKWNAKSFKSNLHGKSQRINHIMVSLEDSSTVLQTECPLYK